MNKLQKLLLKCKACNKYIGAINHCQPRKLCKRCARHIKDPFINGNIYKKKVDLTIVG